MKDTGYRSRGIVSYCCFLVLLGALMGNTASAQTNAEVALSFSDAPVAASVGQYFRFTVLVFNNGPDGATNVVMSDSVPPGSEFVSASCTQGTVGYSNGVVRCNAGLVPFYRTAAMTIELKATTAGFLTNLAAVTSDTGDINPTNNQASFTTTVTQARFIGVGAAHALYYNSPTLTLMTNNQVLLVGQHLGRTSDLYNMPSRSFNTPAGTMVGVHEGGSATLLRNGLVLLAGGGNGTAAKTADVYNPATQFFQQVGDMLVYSYGHYATLQSDGTVLLCGGALSTNELFNPTTGTFSLAPGTQCAFNGIYLPSTGRFLYFNYGRAYLYDTNTSTSVETSGFLQPRAYHSATVLQNGKVLVAGGQGTWGANTGPLSSAELYDPLTDTFTWTANLTAVRQSHSACLLPDRTVLVAGGMYSQNDPFSLTNAEIYDPDGSISAPGVGVSDASVVEGDSGTNYMNFSVWLTAPSSLPVTVKYNVTAGTATWVSYGVGTPDYIPVSGIVTFPPGSTNQIAPVPILGDQVLEPAETLYLNLSMPIQAWMARPIATGTILNDDSTPTMSVSPGSVLEGDSGLSNLLFSVSLSAPCLNPVTVDYYTLDGTALAGSDYVQTSGTLTFNPGDTNLMIGVPVIGDLTPEPDETLTLILTNAQNALLTISNAVGTIVNDDGLAGRIHHFDWAAISGPQYQNAGFSVSITARDSGGGIVTNLPWPVRLSGTSTNFFAANLDFDGPSLSPWTTFNYTPYTRIFEQVLYDVAGLGQPSTCLRTVAGGGTNGLTQMILLTGGVPYTFKVNVAENLEGNDSSCLGCAFYLIVGNTNALWGSDSTCYGVERETLTLAYTPPTNGFYPLTLLINRDWWFGDALYVYVDDVQITYPVVTPLATTNFINGIWNGTLTVLQPASNVWLLADDGAGHKGTSNPFDILPTTDLGLTGTSQILGVPPLRTGMQLAFNLTLTNRGPSAGSNILVQSALPSNFSYVSATNSQGTLSNSTSTLQWTINTLPKGTNATARVVLQANIPGTVTNIFTVSNSLSDLNLSNNVLAISNQISPPLLSLASASGLEGPSSATGMVFRLTLSGPSAQSVLVDYFTSDGTGTNGIDYFGTNGTVTIAAGLTNATIKVFPIDNILNQPNRTFTVTLTNPVNAALSVTNVTGTVIDDDAPPAVWIYNTALLEGDSGTTNAVFALTLSKPAVYNVVVAYHTQDGTASSTNDYVAQNSSVTFAIGTTNASLLVPVNGDTVNEPDETFSVLLTSASNSTLGTNVAYGTIINDDAVPGRLDHFAWDLIPSPRYKDWPFQVTLRALDYLNHPATNGVGGAVVTARTENGFLQLLQDDFEDGDSAGWTNYNAAFSAIVTNETAAGGLNSLRLTGSTANLNAGLRRALGSSQPNKISFAVRASRTNQVAGRFTASANSLYRAAVFYFNNNGQMGMVDRSLGFRGVPYQSNRWYQVALTFNWASQKVDCRVDGALVLTNITFPDSIASMDAVLIANQDNATSWWDDFNVVNDNLTNTFSVNPSNFVSFVNGVKTNVITISGAGTNTWLWADDGLQHVGRSGSFDLLPVSLSLLTPASVTEGSPPVSARVTIPVTFPQPLTVALTSTVPSELTTPASVVIPAGQTNATFNLTIIDDTVLDGTQLVPIIASATNLVSATNVVTVADNEPAVLTLSIPTTAAENAGTLVGAGQVTASAAVARSVAVTLISSDTNVVQVPASVTIQSNQTTATFNLVIVDNQRLDGAHTATISTTVANWTNDSRQITVTDDEAAVLRLAGPSQLLEGSSASYNVNLTGTLATNLSINLFSSDTNVMVVPATASVTAGQTSTVVSVTAPDNALFDGTRAVTLSATAAGFVSAATNLTVADNDFHHYTFSAIASPQQGSVGFTLTISARDINDTLMTNYSAVAALSATDAAHNLVPLSVASAAFANGQWSGVVSVPFWEFQGVRITAVDPGGRNSQSAAFDVVPPTVSIVGLPAADLAWSESTKQLYGSIVNTGTLQPLNPFNVTFGQAISVPTLSGKLCASDGGQYVFAALGGATDHICQVDVNSRLIAYSWTLDGYYVEDMAPVLGSPAAVAVSRKVLSGSPRFRGVVAYDNGIARTNLGGGFLGSNVIEPARTPGRMYGYNAETSPAGMQIMTVDDSGISVVRGWGGVPPFAGEIFCRGGWLFSSWGAIYEPERGIQIGSFGGLVADDAPSGRYYLINPGSIAAYDQNTLLPVGATALPGVNAVAGSAVHWGTNGFAFRMNGSQCAVIRTPLVSTAPGTDLRLSLNLPAFPVSPSNSFSCAFTISNQGLTTARNVVLTQTLPPNSAFLSGTSSTGSVAVAGGGVVASLGPIPAGTHATVVVNIQTFRPGLLPLVASLTSDSLDSNLSNNVIRVDVPVGTALSPDSVTELNLPTADLVWDGISQRLLASVPNSDWLRGNSIAALDPASGAIEPRISTAIDPAKLAVSDDGQFLYAGINGDYSIQRINLPSRAADIKFPTGLAYVADMAVLPGSPDAVVVTAHTTLAVYDHGVRRPATVDPGPYNFPYYLAASATNTLVYEAPPGELRRVAISGSGATLLDSSGLINGFDQSIKFDAGRLYSAGGRIIDPEARTVVTNLSYSGLVCPNSGAAKIFYLTVSGSTGTLHAVNFSNFVETGTVTIPNVQGSAGSLIRWGADGLAFRTTAGQIFLVRTVFADDRNNNGLPDSWELQYFGSLDTPNGGPNDDPDGDGFTNLQEYRLGLNPLQFDAMRFLQWQMKPGTGFEMSVLGNLGSSHALLASTDLKNWTAVLRFTCTNLPTLVVDPASANFAHRFYRIAPLSAVPGPTLRFDSAAPLGSNPVTIALQGVPGFSYRIDRSTNLVNWVPLTNFTSTNQIMYFQDLPNSACQFYRAATQ